MGRVRLVERRRLARLAAPLLFLAAVTAAVLLVRSGLDEASRRGDPTASPPATVTTASPTSRPRYYHVRAGDTLAAIAPRFDLTEAELVALNPGIEPTALRIGQRIRVR